ncbi:hypothetical protein BT96DRAFT_994175 [Gymnopus androsaceus JB14]|uniref:Uncharacterized protein n=1 Tax=Gymnopus androsaceus JB14 TaxID=1447944 RepID=A0A6A4HN89_9AGAR|nr:hypothetical protein BT96DRAFT_994175 [Gymnopus androsaceus JB14]
MSIQTDQVIELTPRSVPAISDHNAESEGISEQASIGAPSPVQQLPPVDGGFHAWAFLGAAFFIEALVWGFPDAFGVFLEAYLADPIYTSQHNASSLIPLIGPISSDISIFIICVSSFISSSYLSESVYAALVSTVFALSEHFGLITAFFLFCMLGSLFVLLMSLSCQT